LSFSRRSAPELLDGALGRCGGDSVCFRVVNGLRELDLDNDDNADGFLETGAAFDLRFDRDMQLTTRDDLDAWIHDVIGLDEAFLVQETEEGREYRFTYVLADDLPIAAFNANGDNVGTSLLLPPFTVRDQNGDGNALTEVVLNDGAVIAAQKEPAGIAFNPATDVSTLVLEDGIFITGDSFTLRFDEAMDPQSTEQIIEERLEESAVFPDVDVQSIGGGAFLVSNLGAAVNLNGRGGSFDLVLQPHDVTSAAGITNSTQQITFTITDITVPKLVVLNLETNDTMEVVLETGVPDRINGGAHDNNLLVEGDTMLWRFNEPMEVSVVQADFVRLLNQFGALNAANVINAQNNDVVPSLGNTQFSYTLKAGEKLAVNQLVTLGALNSNVVTDEANGNDIGIALAANQVPRATRAVFIVQPELVDVGGGDTVTVVRGATNPEDDLIEVQDSLVFTFTKVMDPVTTIDALADRIVNANLVGGVRRGTFDLNTVRNTILVTSANNLVNNVFVYPLQGDQEIEITGAVLDFGALPATVLDDNGLSIADNQRLRVSEERFDPGIAPTLASVTGTRVGTTDCGDGLLVADDLVTFTFSEPLDPDSIDAARNQIISALNARANGTDVSAADVQVVANTIFVVTLPTGASLDTSSAIPFNLSVVGGCTIKSR
jgi:hypothetical protein